MPSQTPSTTRTGSAPWSWKGGVALSEGVEGGGVGQHWRPRPGSMGSPEARKAKEPCLSLTWPWLQVRGSHRATPLESVHIPGHILPYQPLNPQVQGPQPSLSSVLPGLSSLTNTPLASSQADEDSASHALVTSPKHKRGRERTGGMSKTDLAWKLRDRETPLRRMKSGSAPHPPKKTCSRELFSGD